MKKITILLMMFLSIASFSQKNFNFSANFKGFLAFEDPLPTEGRQGVNYRTLESYVSENLPSQGFNFTDHTGDYTVTEADNGEILKFDSPTDAFITFPDNLPDQFSVTLMQEGVGAWFTNYTGNAVGDFVQTFPQNEFNNLSTIARDNSVSGNGDFSAMGGNWVSYTPVVVVPSNLLVNGTFDDANGVLVPAGGWNVANSNLNLTSGTSDVILSMNADFETGGNYDITFDVLNTTNSRMSIYAGLDTNDLIQGYTNRVSGTFTVNYNHTGVNRNRISFVGTTSAGSQIFSLDNITITKTN